GMSIAWAIAEYAHSERLGARTLFATHYHELTQLAGGNEGIRNYHVSVREWNDEIIFLRRMVEGGADKSYGIQVARLAGLPAEIIDRAKGVLKQLEENSWQPTLVPPAQPDLFASPPPPNPKKETHPALERLRKIDPLHLTPMQALQLLADLAEEARRDRQDG
ncbi:DNA mismatch repair protein MutS, partial [bacterium]